MAGDVTADADGDRRVCTGYNCTGMPPTIGKEKQGGPHAPQGMRPRLRAVERTLRTR